jgi:hypothetical protein
MADIIPFPKRSLSDAVSTLRRRIDRLVVLAAPLEYFRESLADQHDALGAIRERLLTQASRSYAIGALARSVEGAIMTGDHAAMRALQSEIEQLRQPIAADRVVMSAQQDAAD